jgi:hypothetical protein
MQYLVFSVFPAPDSFYLIFGKYLLKLLLIDCFFYFVIEKLQKLKLKKHEGDFI